MTISQTDMANFVAMSAGLTGFASSVIAPTLDAVDLKTLFFQTAAAKGRQDFSDLLASYAALVTAGEDAASISKILTGAAPAPAGVSVSDGQIAVAKAVSSLWYLGVWYGADGSQVVISDQAYINGLAWKTMQAHAMGNSTYTFGYWASPPAAGLSDYTGVAGGNGQ